MRILQIASPFHNENDAEGLTRIKERQNQMETDAETISVRLNRHSSDSAEKYTAAEHIVFPGISIIYQDSHTQDGDLTCNEPDSDSVFEIFHCREGRMECHIATDFCYLSPGDLLIVNAHAISSSLHFPLNHYHGIIIRINTAETPNCLSCLLHDVAVQPKKIEEKFCGENGYFIARSNLSVEHIFSELYKVPNKIRHGYSKIKVLELMLFLSVFDVTRGQSPPLVSPNQVSHAKIIAEYLSQNMYEKITLEQAANKFHISETSIKNAFKKVYGVSFFAYIKTQKMESAAYMLEYTDKTVIEIASEHGYDNASKFAVAFRSVKGRSFSVFRFGI